MSSIRNEAETVSKGDLKILDDFMHKLGFKYYPGHDNKSEPANMPWSTRWYRPETLKLTDGKPCTLYVTVDLAQFMFTNLEIKSE